MEQVLLVLFILFSVVSALLDRRKRQRQLAEAQAKQRQGGRSASTQPDVEPDVDPDEEADVWGGWPLPGDPFEAAKPKPARRREPVPRFETTAGEPVDLEPQPTSEGAMLLDVERQARDAEIRARREEARMRQAQPHTTSARPAERPMADVQSTGRPAAASDGSGPRVCRRYRLTPVSARQAVVWAEILGPCKAEGGDGDRW